MARKIVKAITDVKPSTEKPISIKANPKYGNVALGVQVKERGQWIRFRFAHDASLQHPQVKITQVGKEPIYVAYQVCKDFVEAKKASRTAPYEGMFGNLHSRYYLAKVDGLIEASNNLAGVQWQM